MIPIEKQTYGSDGSHYHSLSNDIKYGTNKFANLSVKINDIKNLYLPARIIKFKWPAGRPIERLAGVQNDIAHLPVKPRVVNFKWPTGRQMNRRYK
jgi:hypothetical protein